MGEAQGDEPLAAGPRSGESTRTAPPCTTGVSFALSHGGCAGSFGSNTPIQLELLGGLRGALQARSPSQ